MNIRYTFCLLLFFSFLFGVNQIVFRKPIIFSRDLYIGHYDISLLGDTSVNGGMESDGTINAVKVSINTDPVNATSLTIGNNTDQLNIFLQSIPVNQQLDTYLMYDPISFLVCSFKHGTPEPDDLKVDELIVSEIGGNMNSSLLINGAKGDTFIGNLTNKISCQAEQIFFDADISSTQNKIICASKTKVSELLKATNLISQNANLAKTSLTGATIKTSTVDIKNISTGNSGIFISAVKDVAHVDFKDTVVIWNSFFVIPENQEFKVFLEAVPTIIDEKNGLIAIDSNNQLYILDPSITSVIVPEMRADSLNVERINTTASFNTEVKADAFYLNSAKVAIGKQLVFSNRAYIKNSIIVQEKSDFNISVSAATLNLKNNLANPNAADVIIKAGKDEGDYIVLTINGFLRLRYGAQRNLSGYAFLVNQPNNMLARTMKLGDSGNRSLPKFSSQEEFNKYIMPKLFQYKKEYCDDQCLRLGKQRDRLGLLADDLVVLESEKFFDGVEVTTKNQERQVIDYDERLLAETMIQQIHFFYKKFELFQQKLKKHNESILTLVDKIKTVEKEIIEKEVFLNSLREDIHK